MLLTHVSIQVKLECVDAFRAATLANVRASRLEPGVIQFDFFGQSNDPTRFLLIEGYRDANAQAAHKETAHYLHWREYVAPMMACPRSSTAWTTILGGIP